MPEAERGADVTYSVHCAPLPGVPGGLVRRFALPVAAASDAALPRRSVPYAYPTMDAALAGAARLLAAGREVRRIAGPDAFEVSGQALHDLLPVAGGAPPG
jgi:hypothetical protein